MTAQDTAETRLGKSVLPLARAYPRLSGVIALADGRDAFAARARLADAAERTLDVQYYIWQKDMSGTLLFEALRRAADRGVRVRLLLDDNNTYGLDTFLAAANAHRNFEVRLFNTFKLRRWRVLGYLTDFARLNRRMHNKSFTADGLVTIVGGRNVGDEYFDAGQGALFIDLDVLAAGPVVKDVANDFERYWTSPLSRPAKRVLPDIGPPAIAAVMAAAARVARDPAALAYTQALAKSPFVQELLAGKLPFDWTSARLVSDDPAKAQGRVKKGVLVSQRLMEIFGSPERELQLVSPYFVPMARGVEALAALARQGVRVTVLTNALEATDVPAVHAGYAKRRKPLLAAGVALFELRREASGRRTKGHGLMGSSGSSLHAKTFSADRARVFVGSFNFDPRSQRLNTEMGLVIDSPALAQSIADAFADDISARAYEVRLGSTGKLQWVERKDGQELVHEREPGASLWRRLTVSVLSRLPIEWLL